MVREPNEKGEKVPLRAHVTDRTLNKFKTRTLATEPIATSIDALNDELLRSLNRITISFHFLSTSFYFVVVQSIRCTKHV